MTHIKVKIKPLDIEGVVLLAEKLDPETEYIVRYKGNGGGYVSQTFKSEQLEIIKINLESN